MKGQYSALQVKQTNGGFLNGMPPVSLDHTIKYLLPEFKKLKNTTYQLGYKYVLQQQWADPNVDYAPPPKSYGLLRMSLSTTLPADKLRHQFSFSIENALNTAYRDYLSRFRYYADQQGINFIINYSINL